MAGSARRLSDFMGAARGLLVRACPVLKLACQINSKGALMPCGGTDDFERRSAFCRSKEPSARAPGRARLHQLRRSEPSHAGLYREHLVWEDKLGHIFEVPQRFVTDFASVPRPIWWLFPPWAKYGNAAVVHDYVYWKESISCKDADAVILEGMEDLHVSWITRQLIYLVLRLFGCIAWWENNRERAAGHIHEIIKNWPPEDEAATITWKDWRKKLQLRRSKL
jgi:uncharacterized protein DUF1353